MSCSELQFGDNDINDPKLKTHDNIPVVSLGFFSFLQNSHQEPGRQKTTFFERVFSKRANGAAMSVSFLRFSLAASYSHFPPPLFGLVVLLFRIDPLSDFCILLRRHFSELLYFYCFNSRSRRPRPRRFYWNRTEQMTYTVWRAEVRMTMMGLMNWRGSWLNGEAEKEAVGELESGCCCLLINL